jgi:hypothetical protein
MTVIASFLGYRRITVAGLEAVESQAPHFERVYRWIDAEVYRKSTGRGPATA